MPKVQVDLNEYENEVVSKLKEANPHKSKEYIIKMIISKIKLKEVEGNGY